MQWGSSMLYCGFILSSKFGLLTPDLLMAWSERLAWVIFLVSQNHENKHQPCWIGKSSHWPDLFVVMFFFGMCLHLFLIMLSPHPIACTKNRTGDAPWKNNRHLHWLPKRNLWEFDHQTFAKHSYIILEYIGWSWWMWTHSFNFSWHRTTSGYVSKKSKYIQRYLTDVWCRF